MKYQKKITLLLILSICMILMANAHYLFWHRSPGAPESETIDFAEDMELLTDTESSDPLDAQIVNEDINPADIGSTVQIKEIPLPLEDDMAKHLENFRNKASALNQAYPNSFMISVPTENRVVALTFDDGPDRGTTKKIIELLDTHHISGTFFLIGQQLAQYPEVMDAAIAGGHQIANHSWSHPRPLDIDVQELLLEIENTQLRLQNWASLKKHFRPPYGLVTPEQMSKLDDMGYTVISWSVDSMDWYFEDPEDIAFCVLQAVHPGAIVLMHSAGGKDNRRATLEALPEIIKALKERQYTFVTVEELLTMK